MTRVSVPFLVSKERSGYEYNEMREKLCGRQSSCLRKVFAKVELAAVVVADLHWVTVCGMDAEAALDLILNGSDDDISSVEELDSSEESLMSSSEEESMDEDQNASNDSSDDEGLYQTESSSDA